MAEASKYPVSDSHSLFSLGFWGDSPILFLGADEALLVPEGASSGSEGSVAMAMDWDPLRVVSSEDTLVLNGRKEPPCGSVDSDGAIDLAIVSVGSIFARPLAEMTDFQLEEGEQDEGWNSSYLAKFNRCLSMPMEGFEEEILYLLRRMKERIDQKRQDGVSRKTKSLSSKSIRELKKLEWTVSYKKARIDIGLGNSIGASMLGCK